MSKLLKNGTQMPKVYAWLPGQADNVGDSVLRRPYAHALKSLGDLRVYAGNPSSGYADGLQLDSSEFIASKRTWFLLALRGVIRGKVTIAYNAGELVPARWQILMLRVLQRLMRVRRDSSSRFIWVGAALREESARSRFLQKMRYLARDSHLTVFRNQESVALLGSGVVMPDWAFAISGFPAANVSERSLFSVVLRGDRPRASDAWVDAIRAAASRLGLQTQVVVQVERDGDAALDLAERLGARLVAWEETSHPRQEARVRRAYQQSRVIVADRLHALIMAFTEGAIPLGWTEAASSKICRHFEVIDPDNILGFGADAMQRLRYLDTAELTRMESHAEIMRVESRQRIESVVGEIIRSDVGGRRGL